MIKIIWLHFLSSDDHAHGEIEETVNMFDINEMIPYVDTILREDDKVLY